jgi:hypothetical protein
VTPGGRALAQTLRVNTTISSLNLGWNNLGEGGERTLAEALRVNTTLTEFEGKL